MSKKIIVGNWKENPKTQAAALRLFKAVAKVKKGNNVEVVVCPPLVHLDAVSRALSSLRSKSRLALGAQNVFWKEEGPYTGEVGPTMLKSLGVRYVIIGHSERRKWLNETDEMVNKKIKSAAAGGMKVILCVGESIGIRKKGLPAAQRFVKGQLVKDLKGIEIKNENLFIAYEPLWAIGTGKNASSMDVSLMAGFIKSLLKKIYHINPGFLYGGSVDSGNITDYVQLKEIDGALVGGASIKAEEFKKIINLTSKQ